MRILMFSQYFNNYLQIVSSSSLQNPRIRLPKQPTTYYIKVGGGNSRTHLILNPKYYKLILHPFVCIKNHNNFRANQVTVVSFVNTSGKISTNLGFG